ncbi:MAG: hypothetical protein R3195_04520 [Gemmatimonadota bacterium]|nr:hypothetical protein [Gemmatimonadota bacterium]
MRRSLYACAAILVATPLCASKAGAVQVPDSAQVAADSALAAAGQALSVFLDCERRVCDFDHFRREVGFVNYARDRQDAEVHVLVTTQETGGGGDEYTFAFIGLGDLEGRGDTLVHVSRPDDTDAEIRDALVQTFRLGLIPYVARTPTGRLLDIRYLAEPIAGAQQVGADEDPWDLWSFRARISGEFEGEERQTSTSYDASFSANRTTEALKIDLGTRGEWENESFELNDGSTLTSFTREWDVDGLIVFSIGDHWSTGALTSVTASTQLNQDLAVRAGPAIEYNIFPYAESTRKQLTFLYQIGMAYFDYEQITLFDKTMETRPENSLDIAASVNQPWGEISGRLEASAFLDDWSQHRIDLSGRVEVRIFRGLSLDVSGGIARVKDQIYLSAAGVSDEDILLERRQLGTDFEYSFDFGLSFNFGSRFNNVVNPRMRLFGGGGGNFF